MSALQFLPRGFAQSWDSIVIERLELTAVQGMLSPHKEVRAMLTAEGVGTDVPIDS